MTAILFGSISTIADTSELQRQAFNEAFQQHGLDWDWDRETYRSMLDSNGGRDRIAAYAQQQGADVDADAVYATKSEKFQQALRDDAPQLREDVAGTIQAAHDGGLKVALVTSTSAENVAALLDGPDLDFDLVVDKTMIDAVKPDGAAYAYALEQLGEDAATCVAIEDNLGGVQSAQAEGVAVVAFPNANTAGHDFGAADDQLDRVTLDTLEPHLRRTEA